MPDVSVVVPVYRNADTLRKLHTRLASALEREALSFELILVDDACPARSGEIIADIAHSDSRVRSITLSTNSGQHRALLAGIAAADGRWTVLMDADLQDPPEAIPLLIAEGDRGHPVVFAGRRGRYESASRMFSARLYRKLLHTMSGIPRDAGAFVILRRDVKEKLVALEGPEPFIVSMIWCTGFPLISIPVARVPRATGESAYSGLRRLRSAWRAFYWIFWQKAHG
jgi:glycosyltransferase involved in cell wall biosynthesis